MENQNDSANHKINNLWERACLGLLTILVSILLMAYQGVTGDLKETQAQVAVLQSVKVSKDDMNSVETRLNNKIDAAFSNLVSRSASDKQDILARLDLYFAAVKNRR